MILENFEKECSAPKREYKCPQITISFIEMEQGIAAGSANVKPGPTPDEEWDKEDQTGDLDW
ncbi:hypothetical protein HZQ32_17050 [Elizabethkingia anophelis]|nr:hypothetical protein [Elizabethkingia anophelis]